ncbi:MAG: hypothetical protein AABX85_00090 [Nanoarchaeota archaeon]
MGIKDVIRFITKKDNLPFKKMPLGIKLRIIFNVSLTMLVSLYIIFLGLITYIDLNKIWGFLLIFVGIIAIILDLSYIKHKRWGILKWLWA